MGKTSGKTAITIIIIAAIFIAVLAACIGIQLYISPDFNGFSKEAMPELSVTYATGEDATEGEEGEAPFNWQDHNVLIVGDSLTLGARKEIAKVIEDATIDGKESRGMSAGLSVLRSWEESGIMTDDSIIVVCLGNNITDSTIKDAQQIIDMIKPGQSLIMMTGHGRSNMAPVNEFIRSLPRAYSYITVADWDLTIAQSPSLLSDDGIHIAKNQGNALYADLILKALEVSKPK